MSLANAGKSVGGGEDDGSDGAGSGASSSGEETSAATAAVDSAAAANKSGGSKCRGVGMNLRVTWYCNQGERKYMEDVFSVGHPPPKLDQRDQDLEYAYFGIFDGHGGREAAVFARVRNLFSFFH